MDSLFLVGLAIRVPPVIFSLCLHELMHGWAALKCGDTTAKDEGRLTLNPLAHLDPLGTICLLVGPIGWAKPVPVTPDNFRRRKLGEIVVSLAGVTSNVVLAIVLCLVFRAIAASGWQPSEAWGAGLLLALYLAILVNFGLAIFNLLPIAPLDGHHVVRELLPGSARARFMEFSRYGPWLLIGLVLLDNGAGMKALFYPVGRLMAFFAGPEIGDYWEQANKVLMHSL